MKYVIVGYGNIGKKRHSALTNKCVATVDPNLQTNAIYRNVRELSKVNFDSVILSVPQQSKFDLTKHFLSIGKNVLVEKPFIINMQEANELEKLAQINKCIWYSSYNHQFEPNISKLIDYVKAGKLGELYHGRFVYSFGNIKERIGTWRESTFGVLEEIAPHLIALNNLIFGYKGKDYKNLIARKVESDIYDHWIFSTCDDKVIFEISAVTWKNVFSLDLFGKMGSIHVNGLRKWLGSQLIIRKRVFPAGIPEEKIIRDQGIDVSWKKDIKYFERMVRIKETSMKNDQEVSKALANIATQSSTKSVFLDQYRQILNA